MSSNIKFACPECSKAYKVPPKYAGKRFKCKQCGVAVRVPADGGKAERVSSSSGSKGSGSGSSGSGSSGSGSSKRSERRSGRSSRSSSRSKRSSGSKESRVSGRSRKAKAGAKTEAFKPVDLTEGNEIKKYQKTKDEEYKRGEGRLVYFEKGKPYKAFRMNKKGAVVGRGDDASVKLPTASVSNEHMKIEYKLGTFIATDLGSTNGIVVNGRTVRRASLKPGDVIQLGQAVLRFDC